MKLFGTIAILAIFLSPHERECTITNKGLNNIIVDSSLLKDVKNDFGAMSSAKEWQNSVEMEIFGNYRFSKTSENQGIIFYAERKKGKKIINDIIITEGCPCKTKDGIRIGSTYGDLSKVLGQPYFNNDKRKPSRLYEPNMYFKQEKGGLSLKITYNNFYFTMSSTDTTEAKINRIRIF